MEPKKVMGKNFLDVWKRTRERQGCQCCQLRTIWQFKAKTTRAAYSLARTGKPKDPTYPWPSCDRESLSWGCEVSWSCITAKPVPEMEISWRACLFLPLDTQMLLTLVLCKAWFLHSALTLLTIPHPPSLSCPLCSLLLQLIRVSFYCFHSCIIITHMPENLWD